MFRNSEIVRPLYDTLNGGPPKAFQCLLTGWDTDKELTIRQLNAPCKKVCRTERGMRMHLKLVHNFEAQSCMFPSVPNAETQK